MSYTQSEDANPSFLTRVVQMVRLSRLFVPTRDDTVTSHDQSPSHLCNVCEDIGLEVDDFVVKDREPKSNRLHSRLNLGPLQVIREKTFCPLCRLVIKIADRPLDQRVPSRRIAEDSRCFFKWVIDGQEYTSSDKGGDQKNSLCPRTRRLLVYSEPQTFKDGYLVLLADDAPSPEFFGRRVLSPDLDVSLLQSWLSACEIGHGNLCSQSLVPLTSIPRRNHVFRVIDVNRMCVTEASNDCRYIALSYLWGINPKEFFRTTPENLYNLSTPGGLKMSDLPRTIQDAIEFTKAFGEQYLWIDSLCLIHSHNFQYHDADRIYAEAALTVVAGSGRDANAGLPGVRKGSRTFRQEIERVKPNLHLMISHLAEDYISTSQWDSRAWTFQERILSRRCLLFVNGRIYFQCRRTTFCEDINSPLTFGRSLDSIDMPTRIFQCTPFVQFTATIELYTRRSLTYPWDILNAFEGVQGVLESRLQTRIHYGLPAAMFDSALLWESAQQLHRRDGFPSWSWVGWMGKSQPGNVESGEIQWDLAGLPENVQSWIDWRICDHGKSEILIKQNRDRVSPPLSLDKHEMMEPVSTKKQKSPILRFNSISVFFILSAPSTMSRQEITPLRKRQTGPSTLSTSRPAPLDTHLIRAGLSDRNHNWCGSILLDDVWVDHIGQTVEFVLLSTCNTFTEKELYAWQAQLPRRETEIGNISNIPVYNVLMIEKHGATISRIGSGRVLQSSVETSCDPGPVWKEFLLE